MDNFICNKNHSNCISYRDVVSDWGSNYIFDWEKQVISNKWDSYTKEKKKALLEAEDGWMVKNILLYGNSLVPAKDVNKYGEQHITRRLTSIIGSEVTLEKRENKEIGTLYIAEESLRDFECRR